MLGKAFVFIPVVLAVKPFIAGYMSIMAVICAWLVHLQSILRFCIWLQRQNASLAYCFVIQIYIKRKIAIVLFFAQNCIKKKDFKLNRIFIQYLPLQNNRHRSYELYKSKRTVFVIHNIIILQWIRGWHPNYVIHRNRWSLCCSW